MGMSNSLHTLGLINGSEWWIIFLVVLLLFGAKKLPQLARGVGKSMGEFKRAKDEFEHEIQNAEHEERTTKSAPKAEPASTESSEAKD